MVLPMMGSTARPSGPPTIFPTNVTGTIGNINLAGLDGSVEPLPIAIGAGTKRADLTSHALSSKMFPSALATFNGITYIGYLDVNAHIRVGKLAADKTFTSAEVDATNFGKPIISDDHGQVSIGVDGDGFIHVTANMHVSSNAHTTSNNPNFKNFAWQYWVSDSAEDITAFTFKGDGSSTIPGAGITYPFFSRSNAGVLWVTCRDQITRFSSEMVAAGGVNHKKALVARYDKAAKTWEAVGGTISWNGTDTYSWRSSTTEPKGVFHSDATAVGGSEYQPYLPRLFFDKNDRLWAAAVCLDGAGLGSGDHTHVLLVYADSSEHTKANPDDIVWKNAGGTTVTLPVTPVSSPGGTVVGTAYTSDATPINFIEWNIDICVDVDGNPVMIWDQTDPTQRHMTRFKSGAWETPFSVTAMPWVTSNTLGVLTFGNGTTLMRAGALSTPMVEADFTAFNVDSPSMSRRSIIDNDYQVANPGSLMIRFVTNDSPKQVELWEFVP